MISFNENVNALHKAFCEASGVPVPLTFASERWLLAAHNEGVTPDDIKLSVQWRRRKNKMLEARYQKPVSLSRMFSNDELIAMVVEEAAEVKAQQRKVVVPSGRAEVLRATGRDDTTLSGKPAQIADNIIQASQSETLQFLQRKAAG